MTGLKIKFSSSENSAVFSGNTYEAKDRIKQLGRAKWNGSTKTWTVYDLNKPIEEIQTLFADCVPELEQLEEASEKTADGVSVSSLSNQIKAAIEASFTSAVNVYGRVQKVARKGGRVYIDLADLDEPKTSLSCVMWGKEEELTAELVKNGFELAEDLQVMFLVRVSYYEAQGRVSLSVIKIIAEYTISKLAALRDVTNKQLAAEGVFELNKKLPFPFLPKKIGILTSEAGTVLHDFLASLEVAEFGFELIWQKVTVQGSSAKKSIAAGLASLEERELDLVLLFRGGGSVADLAIFNDLDVARAVCMHPVPVLSAIGHQEDQCSVQDVSHKSFGVPKDLGRFLSDIVVERRESLSDFAAELSGSVTAIWDRALSELRGLSGRLGVQVESQLKFYDEKVSSRSTSLPNFARQRLSRREEDLKDDLQILPRSFKSVLANSKRELESLSIVDAFRWSLKDADRSIENFQSLIQEASPERQLARGYALVREPSDDTKVLSSLEEGQQFELVLKKQIYLSKVEKKIG